MFSIFFFQLNVLLKGQWAFSSFFCADLYILPPDFALFDSDSDDKVELESLYRLSGRRVAAPTKVILQTSESVVTSSVENKRSTEKTYRQPQTKST